MFDRFRSLTIYQQIAFVAFCVAAICVVLVSIWYGFVRVSYKPLFSDLRPTDAATIVAELERKKVSYELADGGATILAPADVVDRMRLDLMTEDLPLKGTVGFELFDKSDLGLTDFTQQINYQRALQGELERTIATLDGVESARVHLSLGEDRIFRDDRVPPKASVTVRMQKSLTLSASAARGIQRLIAAAVPNLEVANVVILDENGRIVNSSPPVATDVAVGTDVPSPVEQEGRAVAQYYEARARLVLARDYPLNNLTVHIALGDGALTTAALAGSSDDAQLWSPSGRKFPLKITLVSATPLDDSMQVGIRMILAQTVGFDAVKNDILQFSEAFGETPLSSVPLSRPVPRSNGANVTRPIVDSTDIEKAIAVAAALLLLVTVTFFAARRMQNPRRLSETQRADLVAKFRMVLERGERHAL